MLGVNVRQRLSLFYLSGKKLVEILQLIGRQTYSCSGIRATAAGQGVGKLSGIHITAFVTIISVITLVADIGRLFDPAAVLRLVGRTEFSAFYDPAFDAGNAAFHIRTKIMLVTGTCISAIAAEVKGRRNNGTICFDLSGDRGRISVNLRGDFFESLAGSDPGFDGNSVC